MRRTKVLLANREHPEKLESDNPKATVCSGWDCPGTASYTLMMHFSVREWEIAGAAAGVAAIGGALWWLLTRRRPTEAELEHGRRELLVGYGRIVDGVLMDHFQIESETGETREMLLYHYEISGVTYECSQDVTALGDVVDPALVRVGMPCSVRYQPGSPENSILVAERWNGIRETIPAMWLVPFNAPFNSSINTSLTANPAVPKQNMHAMAG